ncbi:hypothetical protein [Lachnoclostridium phytofermentans]|uniref:Uncharacterized protein n=1 Tax=Lachnoclostridium phytofermentans (strain ATCC 700394 / DSM 18823 / ISDg) TaxID=357809 RepID=A9KIG7_LACP7|nr:hypothetical protein [Lachnoclostridium phytofermentans]ABX42419.1 hypothetical protein Cphy_2051 [Lachnoclostridium phytofermentans ISDg]
MLYHVSNISGLKSIEPRSSTHGKPYVYAADNFVISLLFGVRQDDFDFIIDLNNDGVPEIYECYEDALVLHYKEKQCSVYRLKDSGFLKGQTSWDAELVSEHTTYVESETVIKDLYPRLMEEEADDNLIIHRYENTIEYKHLVSMHIVDRLIRFNAMKYIEFDERFQKYYSKLIQGLNDLMSGHYLNG